jgi:two-component system cell cycle response regulator
VSSQIASKVLLVDDDELVRKYLGAIIAAEGYEVATAFDADAALVSMQRHFSPIVILDVNMPGMDGLDLCRAIRRQTYSGYVYVMLHTSKDAEEDVLAGLDAGADDYLSKTTPKSQLVGRLRTARRVLSLERSLKAALGEREKMAMTDVLTGAFNRRYLLQHLTHELDRARRGRSDLSVLVLDFDHFSHVNDRYGHAAGDAALAELAKRIQGSLRRNCDWFARLGGDEFVVVLPQTDLVGSSVMAEKLLRAVEATPMSTDTGIIRMSASIGASGLSAFHDRDSVTPEILIELADQCLYKSKKAGRGCATILETTDANLTLPTKNSHSPAEALSLLSARATLSKVQ